MDKKEKKRAAYISIDDLDELKAEMIEAATTEARNEVIKLLGGVISGMNVPQILLQKSSVEVEEEQTEDVMDDADVAGLAMGWMAKGD